MSRFVLTFIFILAISLSVKSAQPLNYVDSTHCVVKPFDAKKLEDYRHQRNFNYENLKAKNDSPIASFWQLLSDFFDGLQKAHVGKVTVADVILYGLILFAAAMIVIQLFNVNVGWLFSKNAEAIAGHRSYTENVHELDFESLINEALSNSNYRLATRLYYLSTLKKLSDANLINWQKNKTNFEYYYELKDGEMRIQFYDLTRIFESVWYGNLEISSGEFDENLKAFTGFLQNIGPHVTR